ncbi:sensor histidine kinase [Streptomyces griseoaurantiacus]|uniref:histidine kinase n=1 Tax=Streptomyces griseoaurantiacus TaxID=68213 RepID=A0A1G7MP08_9ACTN|nr:histidine kinase [Streptomyces jietaisiensis]SDF62839.1 Signal transduction histidine kinase [Streptomyces jietaisiensis]
MGRSGGTEWDSGTGTHPDEARTGAAHETPEPWQAPSTRESRMLWWGSAALVLAVLGTSVLVAGEGRGGRLPLAEALVLAQVCALRWQTRAPATVLAAHAATGLTLWALLPAVTLTGALLAAQITLCVLSALRPPRTSARALAAMCAPAPLALVTGGTADLVLCLLAPALAWTLGQWRRTQRERARAELRRALAEERERLAREVHDVVAHTLSVMVVQAGAAEDVFAEQPAQARQALRAIETGARSALGELRTMLRAFRPETAEEGPAAPRHPGARLARLAELADPVRATGMTVHVHHEGILDGLPAAVDLAAYRIVQEALTNALRHAADADEVSVRVRAERDCVNITVTDNGLPGHGRSALTGGGRGLVGMRERARLLGGSLRAGPRSGGGFEVAARLPVERVS